MSNEQPQIKSGPILYFPSILEEVIGDKLTLKQELFCRYYTQNPETCLNGTHSYGRAYGFDFDNLDRTTIYEEDKITVKKKSDYTRAFDYCGNAASRMIRNAKVSKRITELFNEMLRDDVIDAELLKIIMYAPKPSDRVAAIKEYNSLKQRIVKKLDLTTKGESLNLEDRAKIEKALEGAL